MKSFLGEDFLLSGEMAEKLYELVKDMPIIDYHCHLSPREIYENRRFQNIGSLWLDGDHYKWRLMRAGGVEEEYITGKASHDEKFLAFAKVLSLAPGNPVYHWAHMELKKYFDIHEPLNEDSAGDILKEANCVMKRKEFTSRSLMKWSNVEVVCTTDDPADSLEYHLSIMKQPFGTRVIPSFRPDKAVNGLLQSFFREYVMKLTKGSISFAEWLDAITERIDFFCSVGCRVSDLSLSEIPASLGSYNQAKEAFDKAMSGQPDKASESDYISYMVCFLAREYIKRDIVMQLHLSSLRNNSSRLFKLLGADCGNDSVGSSLDINNFGRLLNKIESNSGLPKLIVYTLNPTNYYEISTMIGCFQGRMKGMAQLGAAWWFCDHTDGILEQMKVLSVTGLLGKFNGMLTDSRSFTSFVRHEYFRRILSSFVGELVSRGEFDISSAKKLVQAVSYNNAKDYFGI
jgi:glucuronate isomerase